jgi:hypothetical protein
MMSDFLYFIPALSLAKMWSRSAPVYFYVFDYVPSINPNEIGVDGSSNKGGQRGPPITNPGLFQGFRVVHK